MLSLFLLSLMCSVWLNNGQEVVNSKLLLISTYIVVFMYLVILLYDQICQNVHCSNTHNFNVHLSRPPTTI